MKLLKTTLAASLLIGSIAMADEYSIEGMHCSGCKDMITKNVCNDKEIAAKVEKCSVELVDKKKQTGKLLITPKVGNKIELAQIEKAIKAAGEEYKVTPKTAATAAEVKTEEKPKTK